jgi:phosphate transport system substrate-binding protein
MHHKIGLFIFSIFLFACSTTNMNTPQDTVNSGTIRIAADESFKPFLDEQIKVFKSSNPKANFIVTYKSEIECLKDFTSDSTRMIFITRGLDKREEASLKNHLGFTPTFGILAYNAIAILVHKDAKDSLFTMKDLSERLVGNNPQTVVMDGNNLTGVVRFLKDSLVKQQAFGKNVVSTNGSAEVIEYIKTHPEAIGFVAMNWIGDSYDPKQVQDRKIVKTALLECTLCTEKGLYAKPSQATISRGEYSLSLPIYFHLKENAPGLGSGLLNFMSLERGQLLFKRSFLVPAKMSFQKRNSMIN